MRLEPAHRPAPACASSPSWPARPSSASPSPRPGPCAAVRSAAPGVRRRGRLHCPRRRRRPAGPVATVVSVSRRAALVAPGPPSEAWKVLAGTRAGRGPALRAARSRRSASASAASACSASNRVFDASFRGPSAVPRVVRAAAHRRAQRRAGRLGSRGQAVAADAEGPQDVGAGPARRGPAAGGRISSEAGGDRGLSRAGRGESP